ncbi:phage holin family protein [Ruegeria atlantica]|uniref:Phage holin family protein n=2 Tax=Ruegeria atlantica TaxID=81569 RepID=A0AA90Z5S8_9RHOB|nr:phage holin family protein [Ruegeria atlantica]NOE20797.1 phage holin family protein [Ruegeria atlantica]
MHKEHDLRQAPNMLATALRHLSRLIQGELKLAKAELSLNLSRAAYGLVFFLLAALLVLVAIHLLATALVATMVAEGMSVGFASLMVSAGLILVAGCFAVWAKSRLSLAAISPDKTLQNLKSDVDAMKESAND